MTDIKTPSQTNASSDLIGNCPNLMLGAAMSSGRLMKPLEPQPSLQKPYWDRFLKTKRILQALQPAIAVPQGYLYQKSLNFLSKQK